MKAQINPMVVIVVVIGLLIVVFWAANTGLVIDDLQAASFVTKLPADNITNGTFQDNYTFNQDVTIIGDTFLNRTGELNVSTNSTCIILRGSTSRIEIC